MVCFLFTPVILAVDNSPASCSSMLDSIQVSGNEVTRENDLIKWSGLRMGQKRGTGDIELARQKLLDTGLYRDVHIIVDGLCEAQSTVHSH